MLQIAENCYPGNFAAGTSPPRVAVSSDRTAASEEQSFSFQLPWRQFPPDGSDECVKLVVQRLERSLDAIIFVGLGGTLDRLLLLQSQERDAPRQVNQNQPLMSALREAGVPRNACLYAAPNGQTSLVLKKILDEFDASLVLSFSLNRECGSGSGPRFVSVVVIVVDRTQVRDSESYAAAVEEIRRELLPWLQVWWLAKFGRRWQKIAMRLNPALLFRRRTLAVALMILLSCLLLPVPYRPQRTCSFEPAKKSYLASPIDGVIKEILVRPGDQVSAETPLARLNQEQLQWELVAVQAELEAAGKRRDSALASRTSGELRLAQFEQERLRVTIASLEKQLHDCEIRSPIDGVVVAGNIDESNGMPVGRGEALFEIAPLNRMRVEMHLRPRDLATIRAGDRVKVRADADASQVWAAQILRIAPRAKCIDSEVVFIATAEVENPSGVLRPGMMGSVRVAAGFKSVGWLLLSEPYEWLRRKWCW